MSFDSRGLLLVGCFILKLCCSIPQNLFFSFFSYLLHIVCLCQSKYKWEILQIYSLDIVCTEKLQTQISYRDSLTLFPPKTNIFVHDKNYTFSKKGLGHKSRCYSVCINDTCKWISHTLSRIIGPSNTATKIRVPISDTGHMAQISTTNPEILINFHACSYKFMHVHAKFFRVHVKFMHFHANSCVFTQNLFVFMQNLLRNIQSTSIKVPARQL